MEINEKRFRNLVNQAPVAICVLRGKEYIVDVANPKMLELWGKKASQLMSRPIFSAMPDAAGQGFEQLLEEVYLTGKSFAARERPITLVRNGKSEDIFVDFLYEPLRDIDGTVSGIIAIATEVTEQVAARNKVSNINHELEDKIRERTLTLSNLNQIYQYAERTGNFGSYYYNFTTNQLTYSDNLYRLLGCEPQEFSAGPENFIKFIHPDDRAYVEAATDDAFRKQQLAKWVYRVIRKDGKEIYVRGTGNIIQGVDNNQYMIGTLQDISDEKRQEQQLQEKNLSLQRSNADLEEFAYVASHDLQEPLRKILMFSSKLDHQSPDKTESAIYIQKIQHSAARMSQLIQDVLNYSRMTRSNDEFSNIDLNDVMRIVMKDLEIPIRDKDAVIEFSNLPKIKGNILQLTQLFSNLINNSLKFTIERPRISVTSETLAIVPDSENPALIPGQKYLHIIFRDNGIGFEQQYAEQIFNLFQRLHPLHKYPGTGIGLALCKKIVDHHKGIITAQGELNGGACFDIYLPYMLI